MTAAKTLKSVLIATLAILLGLVLLGPPIAAELLYRYELRETGMPTMPAATALPPKALDAFWVEAGESLPMKSEAIWKWHSPVWLVRRSWPAPMAPGERMASLAARAWLAERPAARTGLRWQLQWGATTVWMSRNLSAEDTTATWIAGAWFGRGARGIDAAADAYFGKSAGALDLHELALLVGLTQAPRRYDPDCSPEQARARRKFVLDRLLDAQIVSLAEHDDAVARPLGVLPRECRRE
jgi:hypothetical protein